MPPLVLGFFSPADCAIIFILALIIFGPKKLPEVGKQLGQAMREFRKLSDEFTGHMSSVRDEVESAYKPIMGQDVKSSAPIVRTPPPYDQEHSAPMAPAEALSVEGPKAGAKGLTISTVPQEAESASGNAETKGL